jgi:hypothetical protein
METKSMARHGACSITNLDSMLTIGFFAIAFFAVLGSVWWACLDDND